jgi:hypothetical protein
MDLFVVPTIGFGTPSASRRSLLMTPLEVIVAKRAHLAEGRYNSARYDGGRLPLAIYFPTVVCPTSRPSFRSSP